MLIQSSGWNKLRRLYHQTEIVPVCSTHWIVPSNTLDGFPGQVNVIGQSEYCRKGRSDKGPYEDAGAAAHVVEEDGDGDVAGDAQGTALVLQYPFLTHILSAFTKTQLLGTTSWMRRKNDLIAIRGSIKNLHGTAGDGT